MSNTAQPTFFPNAQSPVINGGVFASVQGDAYFNRSSAPSISERRGMKLLLKNIASGAFHDAAERGDPPKCHPDTRKAILAEILEWIDKTDKYYYSLLWLNGPAGAGKSAIMQTLAELLALRDLLLGSFFFARAAPERNNPTRFVATIAYQLALAIPEVQERIVDAVEADPTIFTRKLKAQADALIIKPMKALLAAEKSSASSTESGSTTLSVPSRLHPRVFVVDALDECLPAAQHELLECIAKITESVGNDWDDPDPPAVPPILFILSSRPEYQFRQVLDHSNWSDFGLSCAKNVALEPNYDADMDIEVFLQATFRRIKDTHPVRAHLPHEWPTAQQMKYLIETSSSQFIYAATAARYIDSPRHNPSSRLDVVLTPGNMKGKDAAFSELDALYRLVLGTATDIPIVLEVLTFLILRTSKMTVPNIYFISTLFHLDPVDVRLALTDMYALMNVPSIDNDTCDLLRLHHASMSDFLTDASRAGEFYIDPKKGHTHLAASYVQCLKRLEEETSSPLFDSMITEFLTHYPHSSLDDELQWALNNFTLKKWLQKMTMAQFYNTNWNDLLAALQEKDISPQTVYPQALSDFDNWVLHRLDQYPDILQTCIPAAYTTFPQYFLNSTAPIFSVVMARRSDTEATELLDSTLFNFQDQDRDTFASLADFFSDSARAGKYYPTEASFKVLANEITKSIYPKEWNSNKTLRIHVWTKFWSPPYNRPYEGNEEGVISLHQRFMDFHFFTHILTRCPSDVELATFMRDQALQLPKRQEDRPRDYARVGRINVGKACLQYIKDCGVPYLEHDHIQNLSLCIICEDLKPEESRWASDGEEPSSDSES